MNTNGQTDLNFFNSLSIFDIVRGDIPLSSPAMLEFITKTSKQMKKLNHTHYFGCYADIMVLTTYNEIVRQFGDPTVIGSGDGKVQFTWDFETEDGVHFYMYDWKEYDGFGNDENIWWHIGRVFGKNAWKPGDHEKVVNELKEHFATVKDNK